MLLWNYCICLVVNSSLQCVWSTRHIELHTHGTACLYDSTFDWRETGRNERPYLFAPRTGCRAQRQCEAAGGSVQCIRPGCWEKVQRWTWLGVAHTNAPAPANLCPATGVTGRGDITGGYVITSRPFPLGKTPVLTGIRTRGGTKGLWHSSDVLTMFMVSSRTHLTNVCRCWGHLRSPVNEIVNNNRLSSVRARDVI